MTKRGARVDLVPWNTKLNPDEYDALFLSNGPGDPQVPFLPGFVYIYRFKSITELELFIIKCTLFSCFFFLMIYPVLLDLQADSG